MAHLLPLNGENDRYSDTYATDQALMNTLDLSTRTFCYFALRLRFLFP